MNVVYKGERSSVHDEHKESMRKHAIKRAWERLGLQFDEAQLLEAEKVIAAGKARRKKRNQFVVKIGPWDNIRVAVRYGAICTVLGIG